jgi:hypothetical protein
MIEELGDSSYFLNSLALDTHDLSTIIFFIFIFVVLYYVQCCACSL